MIAPTVHCIADNSTPCAYSVAGENIHPPCVSVYNSLAEESRIIVLFRNRISQHATIEDMSLAGGLRNCPAFCLLNLEINVS